MTDKTESLTTKLEELTGEYKKTKYNKATNLHLGMLRAKIARIKKEIVASGRKKHGEGYFVKKSGDATVALVGFPSAGKSSLINALANTRSKTAQYAFTTTTVIPGTMVYNDSHIQIFDLPGLIEDAHLGAGRGRMVATALKPADLIIFVVDINNLEQFDRLLTEFRALRIWINERKPSVQISGRPAGGLRIETNRSGMSDSYLEEILKGLGIHNAVVSVWDRVGEDALIDIIANRAQYMKAIVALNKIDTRDDYRAVADSLSKKYGIVVIPVSATEKTNIDRLKAEIYDALDIITIYLKPRIGEGTHPMVLRRGATVGDAARKFHAQIVDRLKCAQVSGKSARFANQKVGVAHVLEDGDTITFIKER